MPCTACGKTFSLQQVAVFSRVFCSSCGSEQSAAGQLGSYLVMGLLGKGGMGAVYRGLDPALDRTVAIKVLSASSATGPGALEQFRREAKAAAQISHVNVARIFAFGIERGQPYIVMEFVKGKSLMGLIEEHGPLDVPFTLHIAMQAADGLAAAADNGLVHGDVKPENILIDDNGTAKLIDFGLASLANQPGSREIWGTPYYISPERLVAGQQIDFRADLYSLGGTMYHALTGKPPFDGDSAAEVAKARLKTVPQSPSQRRPSVDPDVSGIVMRALEREPADRYPSYDSMVGDMRRASARLGGYSRRKKRSGILVSARQTSSSLLPQSGTRSRSSIVPLLVAGIALLAVGGAALFFLTRPPPPIPPEESTIVEAPPVDVEPTPPLPSTNQEARGSTPAELPSGPVSNVRLFALRDEAAIEPNATALIDVLVNDSHPDGVAPEIVEVTEPEHGKVSVTSNNKLSYRPETDYEGTDTFNYTIRHSSGKTAKASVTIKVARKPPEPPRKKPAVVTAANTNGPQIAAVHPPAATNEPAVSTGTVAAATVPEPEWRSDPIRVRFSVEDLIPYASAHGGGSKGSSIVLDDGRKMRLMGHVWQAMPIRYLVTTNTVVDCTFSASRSGSMHAIGLDEQYRTMGDQRLFQLLGSGQSRANRDYHVDLSAQSDRSCRIAVGRYYTGPCSYLVLGSSNGAQPGDVTFADVFIHEVTNTAVTASTSTATPRQDPAKPPTGKPPVAPAQPASSPGLKATVREAGKKVILKTTVLSSLQFDYNQGNVLGTDRRDNLDIEFAGFITIAQEGAYRFNVSADDSAEVLIDGRSVVKAEAGKDQTSGDVQLKAGRTPIVIRFTEKEKDCFMRVKWIMPGRRTPEGIPQSALTHTP